MEQAVRVRTGSRLHFGLIDPSGASGRRYGGAGVMVDEPGTEIVAQPAEAMASEGPLAARALRFAEAIRKGGAPGHRLAGARIDVLRAAPEHCGLGTGTQLGLAVAAAMARLDGEDPPVRELARRAGRGRRSAVGIHGFERGGFIADGGRGSDDEPAPLIARLAVPESWRFLLAVPEGERGLSGEPEEQAFTELARKGAGAAEELCRLLVLGILPGLASADISLFGEAVTEYGRKSGEIFRAAQGGPYASPLIEELVRFLVREGAAGAGQSSWGPAVFALAPGDGGARALEAAARRRFGSRLRSTTVTRARNRGGAVEERREG